MLMLLIHGRNILVKGTKKTACHYMLYRFSPESKT